MSRYDQLSLKYVNFCAGSEQAQRIASDLASAVRAALGAPAEAVFSRPVAWRSDGWRLAPTDTALTKRHFDGRYYVAICIRLASMEASQTFATVLSIRVNGADTEVRLEDTEPKFHAYLADPSAKEDLAGEIIGVIEDTLDPDQEGEPPRLNIGLIDG